MAGTILVTGSTGLLGKGFEETSDGRAKIVGLHARDYGIPGAKEQPLRLDLRNQKSVDELFAAHEFDAVVHAAGIANVDYAEAHYAESLESNLLSTLHITAACRRAGIYLIYISTNAVFGGTKPPYGEDDATHPINKYGRIKAECEMLVRETLENCVIARPILMYGWNHPVCRPNPATWLLDRLKRGERTRLVTDVRENPLYNRQCGEALWRIIEKRPRGVIHLAGGRSVNRYEFGLALAKTFGLDASLLEPVGSDAFPAIAPRPKNTTFATRRMEEELGLAPLDVAQGLELMKRHAS